LPLTNQIRSDEVDTIERVARAHGWDFELHAGIFCHVAPGVSRHVNPCFDKGGWEWEVFEDWEPSGDGVVCPEVYATDLEGKLALMEIAMRAAERYLHRRLYRVFEDCFPRVPPPMCVGLALRGVAPE